MSKSMTNKRLPKPKGALPLCSSVPMPFLIIGTTLFLLFLVDSSLGPHRSWVAHHYPWQHINAFPGLSSRFVDNITLGPQRRALHPQDVETESKSLRRVEAILAEARSVIREAARDKNNTSSHEDPDYVPHGPIYRNPNAFHRSYLEMEKSFRIYVYEEGEPPLFHDGPSKFLYTSEGRFIAELETGNLFRTKDPSKAFVYFLPFGVTAMVQYLYVPGIDDYDNFGRVVSDYVNLISSRYKFWNQSLGADHFMLSCHDWGPFTTAYVPYLHKNSIRVLCNANTSEGFNPAKDVSLPEVNLFLGDLPNPLGGLPPSNRSILAFFAGGIHGYVRILLAKHWKDKDQDVLVYDYLPKGISYEDMMKKSRFCLCPSGWEVASPRVVEAIYADCVPVLISDGYVPPFNDVLNWNAFSVSIPLTDIPNMKMILTNISESRYLELYTRVKQVQRHFTLNATRKRYDVFHMTMHSIWLRRLNVQIQDMDNI